jgi:hypothetical protein
VPASLLGEAKVSYVYETGQMYEDGVEEKYLRGILSYRCMAKVDGVQAAWSPWCVRKEDATLLATERLRESLNADKMEMDEVV